MKKIKLLFLISIYITPFVVFFSSCEPSKQEIKESIDELGKQNVALRSDVNILNREVNSKKIELDALNEKVKEMGIYASGKTPKYILKIHLKQSHFSLSITKHIKDAANAIDFEIPTDKEFYNSVSIGTDIVDKFRVGSLILSGSFGDWKMTVTGKEIMD